MPEQPIPIEFLYRGTAAEFHVMAEFFRAGMEAMKLPVDRGFDLAVTNTYDHLGGASIKRWSNFPLFVQVKSLNFEPDKSRTENNRQVWSASPGFRIKKTDLDLLIETPSAFLVCLVSFGEKASLTSHRDSYIWWLGSRELKKLFSRGYFLEIPGVQDLFGLAVEFRDRPTHSTPTLVDDAFKRLKVDDPEKWKEAKGYLLDTLAEEISGRGNPYICLGRKDKSPEAEEGNLVYRMIPSAFFDLSQIGRSFELKDLLR